MVLENFRLVNDFVWDVANKAIFDEVTINQGDVNGRKMRVQVVNKGVVEDLTGAQLNLAWVANKGGKGLDAFEVVDATQGLFEITFATGMLANVGNFRASLQLVLPNGNGIVESNEFKITNYRSNVDSEAVQSTDSWTALETVLANASDLESNYTPKLFSLEQQLQQTVKQGQNESITKPMLSLDLLEEINDGEINVNVNTSMIDDGAVTPKTTNFFDLSGNIFQDVAINKNKIISPTGTLTDNPDNDVLGLIDTDATHSRGKVVHFSRPFSRVAQFSNSGGLWSIVNGDGNTSTIQISQSVAKFYVSFDNRYINTEDITAGVGFVPSRKRDTIKDEYLDLSFLEENYGNIVWFGDSLSQLTGIPSKVATEINANVYDVSFSGSPLVYSWNQMYNDTGVLQLTEYIKNNNYTALDTALANQATAGVSITEKTVHANTLKNITWSTIDICVIWGGTNDIGSTQTSLEVFEAGIETIIANLISKNPNMQIYFITPPYRGDLTAEMQPRLPQFVNKIVEKAKKNSFPVKNLLEEGGINNLNIANYVNSDLLHQNDNGTELHVKKISRFLLSN